MSEQRPGSALPRIDIHADGDWYIGEGHGGFYRVVGPSMPTLEAAQAELARLRSEAAWRVLINDQGEPYAVDNVTLGVRRGVDTDGNVEPRRGSADALPRCGDCGSEDIYFTVPEILPVDEEKRPARILETDFVELRMLMGIKQGCAPEIFASEVGECVAQAILLKWQKQSILNTIV